MIEMRKYVPWKDEDNGYNYEVVVNNNPKICLCCEKKETSNRGRFVYIRNKKIVFALCSECIDNDPSIIRRKNKKIDKLMSNECKGMFYIQYKN